MQVVVVESPAKARTVGAYLGRGYAKARAGLIEGFTGIDDPYEALANPDIAIDTAGVRPELAAERIFARLQCLGYMP